MAKITMSHMVTEKCSAGYNFVLAPLTFSCYCVLMIHFCGATVFPDQQPNSRNPVPSYLSQISHTLVALLLTTYLLSLTQF